MFNAIENSMLAGIANDPYFYPNDGEVVAHCDNCGCAIHEGESVWGEDCTYCESCAMAYIKKQWREA